MPTAGSLFSGAGLLDYGLSLAGWGHAWLCEKEADCGRVLARHFPGVFVHGDVRGVEAGRLVRPDLVCAGTPCQGLSVAGRRVGLADERSGLFWEFVRVADAVAPRWLLWENVAGALSCSGGEDFACVLGGITGFRPAVPAGGWRRAGVCWGGKRGCAWRVLDAQSVGGCPLHGFWRGAGPVPQRRRRVFVVALAGDVGGLVGPPSSRDLSRMAVLPCAVLFEPESLPGHLAKGGKEGPGAPRRPAGRPHGGGVAHPLTSTVGRNASGNRVGNGHNTNLVFQANGHGTFREGQLSLAASDDNGSNNDVVAPVVAHALVGRYDGGEDGTGRGTPLIAYNVLAANSNATKRHAYEAQVALSLDRNGGTPACGQGGDAALDGGLVRRLTPLETTRLMGAPDDFYDLDPPLSDGAVYRMNGNGVAVNVARWLGGRVAAIIMREGAESQ